MERTQISLEPEQADRLRRLAQRARRLDGPPASARPSTGTYGSAARAPDPGRAVGACHVARSAAATSTSANVSENHDDYLDEIYGS